MSLYEGRSYMINNYFKCDLRNQDFSGRNLTSYNFAEADLRGANFTKAIIKNADFSHSNCEEAKFCSAKAGLSFAKAIRLITILFFIVVIVLVVLGYLGQRIGDGIGSSFVKFTTNQSDRDELMASIWAISTCALLFIAFAYNIQRGLEKAFRITIIYGTVIVGLAMLRILILSLVRVSFGYGIPSISGYAIRFLAKIATAAVAGFGISFVAVSVAILIVATQILINSHKKAIVLISSALIFVSITLTFFIHASHSGSVSTAMFMVVTLLGVFLGSYVADQASSDRPEYNLVNEIAIALASLGGTNFQEANLTNADFTGAYLRGADFRDSELNGTCWLGVKFLTQSRLDGTFLYLKDLEKRLSIIKLLTTGEGEYGNFEGLKLQGVNLQAAQLKCANFKRADISNANLRGAELSEAILVQTRLDGTDFTGATLTGAFIERWGATLRTKIDQVKCDYVYMKESVEGSRETERIPHRGKFKTDGFRQHAMSLIGTLDLFHKDDFDSRAVVISFKQLAEKYPEEVFRIVALEKTEDGQFTVKVKTKNLENNEIYKGQYYLQYEQILPSLPSQPGQLPKMFVGLNEAVINLEGTQDMQSGEGGHTTQFIDITVQGGEFHFHNKEETKVSNYNISGGQIGAVGDHARSDNNHFHQSMQNPTLAEAAAEIQKLLKQLEVTNPVATEAEKIAYVNDKTAPSFKSRIVSALQAGGETAIEEFLDNSYVNVVKDAVMGWINPE
ncbi:MAG: pentapeptide repeat-containing protein [Microcoleus sp. PH2017_22_RUC_O_B]|uniref:pentapeptide repeat-containing protein n=1 Tax=unclassified Microcoleus TaxID=2642155 RepID=UPI001DD1E3B7|nr:MULTISPECIES: pentapeptide repeat-containing protein [unclassified Microcoleus]MCC3531426.1 pentapeptide repeat-containing protein [Microcoleus sp. PH2017_21_RUC_O_A]MCC3543735.1 pentapeptide repeat-containing protein [Microcoleus sp. PH2017_22_RUC_O_B]